MNGKKNDLQMNKESIAGSDSSLISNLLALWRYIFRERPLQIVVLVLLMLLASILEMATLAATVPLIGSLVDTQTGGHNIVGSSRFLPEFVLQSDQPYNWILVGIVIIVAIAALVRILVIRKTADFSAVMGVDLQTLLFRNLLYRDYETIINQSSSKEISLVANKIQIVISTYILGILISLTSLVSAIGVLILLIWISTPIVLLALSALIFAYLVIAWLSRSRLKSYGRDLQVHIPQKVQCVQEGLGGIRDVAMGGTQEVFVEKLHVVAHKVEKAQARLIFYNAFPRPLLEAAGICSVAVVAWFAHRGLFSGENLLPTLGVFALGMLRLLPYVQQIFGQWTRLFNGQMILAELLDGMPSTRAVGTESIDSEDILTFDHTISTRDIGFSYQGASSLVFENVNISIAKGDYIGIVGPTGSGKSTLVDILMGLIPPSTGTLLIDGIALDTRLREQWRRQVAHVPQKIYLTQGSVESNIAFAVESEKIDRERVKRCAQDACLDDFIDTLPNGYATEVGEDGVRLSGGQRQRIGIARALYSGCSVLVFDEATNALDEATARRVINRLLDMKQQYTIISITHNVESVKHCKKILTIENSSACWVSVND